MSSRDRKSGKNNGRRLSPREIQKMKSYQLEKRLRTALFYAAQALVDVLIILLFVKGFSVSYNFSHDVFVDIPKTPGSTEYTIVKIEPDFSTSSVADNLYESGVVRNKYVMMAKIKIGEYESKIRPGKYGLSPSMKPSEILEILCGNATANEGEELNNTPDVASITDAGEIHDNSEMGAGDGGSEGDDYVPPAEDGGDAGDDTSDSGASEGGE